MDEFRFGQDLVRALLREQHPDLADFELRDVVGGWSNQQWRLGAELAVRLPRTEHARPGCAPSRNGCPSWLSACRCRAGSNAP